MAKFRGSNSNSKDDLIEDQAPDIIEISKITYHSFFMKKVKAGKIMKWEASPLKVFFRQHGLFEEESEAKYEELFKKY